MNTKIEKIIDALGHFQVQTLNYAVKVHNIQDVSLFSDSLAKYEDDMIAIIRKRLEETSSLSEKAKGILADILKLDEDEKSTLA